MISWIKKLLYIIKNYESELNRANARIDELQAIIKERTEVSADINYAGSGNHIIVVGRYKNVDHVQCFTVNSRDFEETIRTLKEMQRYTKVSRLDQPPQFCRTFLRGALDL